MRVRDCVHAWDADVRKGHTRPLGGFTRSAVDQHSGLLERRLWSTPIAEELHLIPHGRDGHSGAKMKDAAQLLSNREPLLRRQYHSRMFSPSPEPLRVKPLEIGDIEGVEDAFAFGSEGQLLLVGLFGEACVESRDYRDIAGAKSRDETTMHRIFAK